MWNGHANFAVGWSYQTKKAGMVLDRISEKINEDGLC